MAIVFEVTSDFIGVVVNEEGLTNELIKSLFEELGTEYQMKIELVNVFDPHSDFKVTFERWDEK